MITAQGFSPNRLDLLILAKKLIDEGWTEWNEEEGEYFLFGKELADIEKVYDFLLKLYNK